MTSLHSPQDCKGFTMLIRSSQRIEKPYLNQEVQTLLSQLMLWNGLIGKWEVFNELPDHLAINVDADPYYGDPVLDVLKRFWEITSQNGIKFSDLNTTFVQDIFDGYYKVRINGISR